MNKKGDVTLLQAITILAGVITAVMLLSIVARTSSSTAINLNFIAKDSALLTDTVQAVPQNVRVLYTFETLDEKKLDLFGRNFLTLENNILCVGVKPTDEVISSCFVKYSFIPSEFYSPITSSVNQVSYFLIKEGSIFFVATNPDTLTPQEVPNGLK